MLYFCRTICTTVVRLFIYLNIISILEVKDMSQLTDAERMSRWTRALDKTMQCAESVQSIEDPIQRMAEYWRCRAGTSVRGRRTK